ncbi:hypothetical protein ACLKA7_001532 [Drosophila subpalustris]
MDADDGLNLDPHSPASNPNTEEMEDLLRVEEKILNPPEKINDAPKTGKEGISRLSGAARRRLLHFKAKGLPIEQKFGKTADAKTLQTPTYLKYLSPTCPSVEVQPGTTPARFVEVVAESADHQAEKPMTPRPTGATITWEHRYYSEVTSVARFGKEHHGGHITSVIFATALEFISIELKRQIHTNPG